MRVLIVGWGYVGSLLGGGLASQGHEVFGVRRGDSGLEPTGPLASARIFRADIADFEQLQRIAPEYDWVVNCAAASGGGPGAYEEVYVRGNTNLVNWLASAPPRKFVYTSSTGVYGQDEGETVDEDCPTEPKSLTGQALVKAERVLLRAARESGFPAVILRLAGIYGPGRGYWLRQFMEGKATLEGDGARILNMIHREDVAGAIEAALTQGGGGDVCNVVDNEPVSQKVVFEWLAQRLNRPMPQMALLEPAVRKRGATNKRVSNLRLRKEYGYVLKYPTFREGFEAELTGISE